MDNELTITIKVNDETTFMDSLVKNMDDNELTIFNESLKYIMDLDD